LEGKTGKGGAMPSNGGPGIIRIPATIYPGMFEGEVQVTVEIAGKKINLIVSTDSVEMQDLPSETGGKGLLLAEIVQKVGDRLLIDLPGEVQGASNRQYAAASSR
jgi:hypothetical protein